MKRIQLYYAGISTFWTQNAKSDEKAEQVLFLLNSKFLKYLCNIWKSLTTCQDFLQYLHETFAVLELFYALALFPKFPFLESNGIICCG